MGLLDSLNLSLPEGPLFLTGDSGGGNTGSLWGSALLFGADPSFTVPKTSASSTSTALDVMTPNTSGINTLSDFWSQAGSVFLDVTKAGAGYLIAKDASKNQVVQPTPEQPGRIPQGGGLQLGGLLPLLLIGGLIFLAVKD